jgi:hypothetical protein
MIDPSASDQRLLRRLDETARGGAPLAPAERARAASLRDGIDAALAEDARRRAGQVAAIDPVPAFAPHCDWIWRPALWTAPSLPRAWDAAASPRALGAEVTLFHDCPRGEISVRQTRGAGPPFALALDIYAFRGSYLSLALALPPPAIAGLRRRHVIRIDLRLRAERAATLYARLNIQRGAAPATIVRELPRAPDAAFVDFDLATLRTDVSRAERLWIDLILDSPAANRILLEDICLSRRPRAEL